MSFSLSPASRTLAINQANYSLIKNYETSAKIGDYLEFKIEAAAPRPIDLNGNPTTNSTSFDGYKSGFFRWTIVDISGNNITLKIEVSINNFYTVVKDISIINGIMYNDLNETLGYNPFWIPINFNPENVTLGGTINNPEFGKVNNPNSQKQFLIGVRDVFEFVNTNNYVNPSVIFTTPDNGTFQLFFSKYNGIAVELDDTSQIWTPLQFSYNFVMCSFYFLKSNIDFGSIDYPYTLLYILVPFSFPIFIISGIIIVILSVKINEWIRNHLG